MEAIVLDNGSGTMKSGFAGEDTPRALFPSVRAQYESEEVSLSEIIGPHHQDYREIVNKMYPIRRGIVEDWDALEQLWEYALSGGTGLDFEMSLRSILSILAPSSSFLKQQERMAQIMFETHRVNGYYTVHQSVLSLFACGRTSGMVLEIGHGSSHAIPIFEGYALTHACVRSDIGGMDVSAVLSDVFVQNGQKHLHPLTIRRSKETMCVMCEKSARTRSAERDDSVHEKQFELPDGSIISLPENELAHPAEILFQPQKLAWSPIRLDTMVLDSMKKCDQSLQNILKEDIVLAGGTTMLPGIDRIRDELREAAKDDMINIHPSPGKRERGYNVQRKIAAWVGGSMFATLATFADIQIGRQEWEEFHEAILSRKCFI